MTVNLNTFKTDTLNQENADTKQRLFEAAKLFNQKKNTSNEVNIFTSQIKNALSAKANSGTINQNTNNPVSIFNQNNLTNKDASTITENNNPANVMNDNEKAKQVFNLLNKDSSTITENNNSANVINDSEKANQVFNLLNKDASTITENNNSANVINDSEKANQVFNLLNKDASTITESNNTTTTELNNPANVMNDSEKAKQVFNLLNRSKSESSVNIDGKIGDFQQNKHAEDCWLMSGIETLSNTKEGADILSKSIVQNQEGTVSVTLQGADKTYTFSKEEIAKAKDRFSSGDDDVRAIELAVEQYRKNEIQQGLYKGISEYDPLSWGSLDETGWILTKKRPEIVTDNYDNYLNLISENPEKYGAEVGFKYADIENNKKDNDRHNDIITRHAYSIKSVDAQNVTVINPWDTSQEIVIPREEFKNNILDFAFYS